MNELEERVEKLLQEQLADWDLAKTNYGALARVQTRVLELNGQSVQLQLNAERIRSSAAKVDAETLQSRPCFFCNRPEKQCSTRYDRNFEILVNPYPIFENHLTIPLTVHQEQRIYPYYKSMLLMATDLQEFIFFYNGPKCGASAPDHMHFQAAKKESLPIEWNLGGISKKMVWEGYKTILCSFTDCLPAGFLLVSSDLRGAQGAFNHLYAQLEIREGEYEPRMNVVTWASGNSWCSIIYPRKESRPACFFAEGDDNILISPATVEMAGLFVVPRESDFTRITSAHLTAILREVSISKEEQDEIIRKLSTHLS